MTARSPQRPKSKPTPRAPQNTPDEPEQESADLGIDEVLAEYEQQIGALTGQLIQKNIAIRKIKAERDSLRSELTKKRTESGGAAEEV